MIIQIVIEWKLHISRLRKLGMHIIKKIHFDEHQKFDEVIQKIRVDQSKSDFEETLNQVA